MARSTLELGSLLMREGLITASQLDEALHEQSGTRERLGEILRRRGAISDGDLIDALSHQFGYRRFDPALDAVENAALEQISVEFARRHDVLPVKMDEQILSVAMSDPLNLEALDHLRRIGLELDRELEILLAPHDLLEQARETHYSRVSGSLQVSQLIDKVVDELGVSSTSESDAQDEEAERRAKDAGVVNLVDQILGRAIQERATDIHVEPQEHGLVIRFRVDGMLYDALTPPRAVYTGAISRLKILANMDIAERRMAQDGRFTHRVDRQEIDIRVSAVPTIHGEKMVLRLLDKTGFNFNLRDLGFSERDFNAFRRAIHHPYGMILLSGPTGSGKTTTLYSGLLELRSETLNITTVEDPVEYQMERINQVQLNKRKQVTFATALRSFLRQDPDVIMVGEIRDQETADIAIRSALTGHLVFSTIHANDAPATATRLVSMGIEPFMAASALNLVAAQRLVRRNCPHCLEEYQPDKELLLAIGDPYAETGGGGRYLKGKGCAACKNRGYSGRVAIIEMMVLTQKLRQLIADGVAADELRQQAIAEGMMTLRMSGFEKVREGMTSLEEVLRVCLSD